MIKKVFNRHIDTIVRHPVLTALFLGIWAFLFSYYFHNNSLIHGIGYFIALYFGFFIMDLTNLLFPLKKGHELPIKKPFRKELLIIIGCTLLGFLFVSLRFFSDWEHLNAWWRLSILPLVLFAFPIVLGTIYLFVFRYKIKDLGINLNYWYVPILIHIVFGAISLTVAPQFSHWSLLSQDGVGKWLFTGLITAALSEEFTRMLFLTRIGKYTHNMALGVFVAAIVWSLLHFPEFSQNHRSVGWWSGIIGVIDLIPLGVFWGYITYRSKSIIPAIFIHGLNFWGLQNF